jgi:hypothetical protein
MVGKPELTGLRQACPWIWHNRAKAASRSSRALIKAGGAQTQEFGHWPFVKNK